MSEAREALAEAFVQLADNLVSDFDVIDLLHTLTMRCVELLPVDSAGVLIADGGDLRPAGATTESRDLLRLLDLQVHSGPSVECYRAKHPLVNLDMRAERDRWPELTAAAMNAGYGSLHVVPLRLRDEIIGALNLFGVSTDSLPESDLRIGQALADVATISILQQRTRRHAEVVAEQLQRALDSRIVIEQAKGILAEHGRLDMDRAFETLRGYARSHNRRLSDLARSVVDGTTNPDELFH